MHQKKIESWQHSHSFGQEKKQDSEHRTGIVVAMTVAMMVVEIAAGIIFGPFLPVDPTVKNPLIFVLWMEIPVKLPMLIHYTNLIIGILPTWLP